MPLGTLEELEQELTAQTGTLDDLAREIDDRKDTFLSEQAYRTGGAPFENVNYRYRQEFKEDAPREKYDALLKKPFQGQPVGRVLQDRIALFSKPELTQEGGAEFITRRLPFAGAAFSGLDSYAIYKAAKRVEAGSGDETDINKVAHFIATQQDRANDSWGEKTLNIVSQLPAIGTEFALTGGAFTAGRKGAEKLAGAALGRAAQGAAGRVATKVAGFATGAAVQTAANPQQVFERTAARLVPQSIEPQPDGGVKLPGKDDSLLAALPKGFLDTYIEQASERTGASLGKIPGASKLKDFFQTKWIGAVAGRTPQQFKEVLSKAGWHGVLGEMFEERVGDVARSATGLQTWGEAVPTLEQLASEAVAFSVPGAVGSAAGWMQANPQVAAKLAEKEQPSRKDFDEAGLPRMDARRRKEFAAELRGAMQNAPTFLPGQSQQPQPTEQPHALPQEIAPAPIQEQPAAQAQPAAQENVQVEPEVLVEPSQPEAAPAAPQVSQPPPAATFVVPIPTDRRAQIKALEALGYNQIYAQDLSTKDREERLQLGKYSFQPGDRVKLPTYRGADATGTVRAVRSDGLYEVLTGTNRVLEKQPWYTMTPETARQEQPMPVAPGAPGRQRRKPELTPKQMLDDAVVQHVGEDPEHQRNFRNMIEWVYDQNRIRRGERIRGAKQAREITGVNAGDIARWENAGKDYSTWPRFDALSRTVASEVPELNLDPTDLYLDAKVWELLKSGAERLPAKHSAEVLADAYELFRENFGDVQGLAELSREELEEWYAETQGPFETGAGESQSAGGGQAAEAGPQTDAGGVPPDRGKLPERGTGERERFELQPSRRAGTGVKKPDFAPSETKSQKKLLSDLETMPGQQDLFEDVDKAEDDRPDVSTFGFGPGGGQQKQPRKRPDKVPSVVEHPDAEIEKRMQAAHGVKAKPLLQRIKKVASHAFRVVTRAQVNLPNNARFATANEFFRLLKEVPQTAGEDAGRTVSAIVDPLGPKQLRLFERKLIIDNLLASLDRNEPRRFGFKDREEVEAYRDQLDALIEQTPEVQQALASRTKVVVELVDELVAQGILNESAKENAETYYHQQVLSHVNLDRVFSNVSPRPVKRTFQKRRVKDVEELGPESDYNTSYLEAEATWLTDAMIELEKEKRLRALASHYGKQRDEDGNFPEGYEAWQPEPGNVFYRAFTIPEKVAEAIQLGTFDPLEMDPDVRRALAMGGRKEEMILPVEIVAELRATEKPKPSGLIAAMAKGGMKWWKAWTLFKPTSYVGYNLRNLTGDLDPVLGGNPDALVYVPQAVRELYGFYAHKRLAMSPELRASRKHGVIDASMTATEIPDIKDLPLLRRFYEKRGKIADLGDAVSKLKELSRFREAALRHAAFLSYRKKLGDGTLVHYGGAKKEVVDALVSEQGIDVAAAHLSRNLLGDYRNVTVAGDWLRQYLIPFHAWTEINLKRWPRMFINAGKSGQARGKGRALATAGFATFATLQLGSLTAAMYVWNLLMHGDEEEELGDYERANPHIVLGRNSDGSIRVLRNTGALGDMLEWFGLNTALSLLPKYEAGQLTLADMAKESAKDPLNKLVQGTRPDLKGSYEILTGTTAFPDVVNLRSIPRDEAAASVVGLRDEYRAAKGAVAGEGTRARPNYWQKFLGVGISDPRRSAIHDLYDLRERFLEQKTGEKSPNILHESAFKPMREAAYADDYETFKEARQAYLTKNKGWDNFKSSLAHLDPIHARLTDPDEKEFETKFLNARQREQLRVARDYSMELKDRLIGWWLRANREEGRSDEEIGDDVTRAKKTLRVKFSYKRQKGETAQEYTTRKRRHAERKQKAREALSRLQGSP